jgi:hypothetical protein
MAYGRLDCLDVFVARQLAVNESAVDFLHFRGQHETLEAHAAARKVDGSPTAGALLVVNLWALVLWSCDGGH